MPKTAKIDKAIKRLVAVAMVIALIFGVVLYYLKVARPLVLSIAEAKTEQLTETLVSEACNTIKPALAAYGSFYEYLKNDSGEVVLATAKSVSINQAFIMIQSCVIDAINKMQNYTLDIPVGAFSGLSVFAEEGSDIAIKVMPIGKAHATWNSVYKEMGVNQTLHRVAVQVDVQVEIIIPVKSDTIDISTEFVIAEDLIIGRVPESYITGATEDDTFDLIP